jgi:hypothetical protein
MIADNHDSVALLMVGHIALVLKLPGSMTYPKRDVF